MPANKYALLRYRILDRTIRNPRKTYPNKEDLRVACEEALYGSNGERISASTIDKDIWAMRNESELGYYAPIKFSKEYKGYYYEDPNYTIAEVPLTDDDLNAIRTAAETLFQFREIPLFKQFDAAIEKIMDRMKISNVDESMREQEIIQFQRAADYKGSEFLEVLFKCCANKQLVSFDYQKFGSDKSKSYIIEPYLLKEYRNRWYVIGKVADQVGLRTFSLDRMINAKELERFFETKGDFDTQEFFEHSLGITVTDAKPEEVLLRVYEKMAPYIISQPIHHSQKIEAEEKGIVTISIKVLITVELVSTILGFGEQIEVLSPTSLRQELNIALTQTLVRYR
ncbi:MAG: WYL domain-containing protein [Salibacteraceae bacterium]|jgi:predicted DNA-binding transcriptional regulator YafY|nr:WYL domain-containing protein [Salibacteraceae bacterium]MDP4685288.1 WYL domain-containing protein [Salibacteraceae bacterium]MDP4763438.1 WYL domain-containing protein [Salibacteraceae bacterium]MDP4844772.1 WYL domain-containing protein [Salibacteraceae bacterium]MDP4933610.1 WYL domain-containing protein [Salibacteraceae bacterium]